ncbi:Peroxisome proliferator-activated receptor gamma coactivator 1-beta, partial [Dissostichus eleginoides]
YGEEEVCSDRLDNDFPDIDLSQLDTSDFDSVNCLSELQWCNDQPSDRSPASINYSTTDELFEQENAALLAALTDSLDGMVDAEVGGLSVFPVLGEEPNQEEEDEDNLSLSAEDFSQSLGSETEDPSLLKKLLLTPPNVPAGIDSQKVNGSRYSSRSLRTVKPLVKCDLRPNRKPRAVRPSGRLCTELHKHLTTSQFSSEKELRSVVDLITYMHTYCLPIRKQQGWDQRKEAPRPRARNEAPRPPTNTHSRVVLVSAPVTGSNSAPRRIPFARRREMKANSLLRDLLQQSSSYDVSKPYGLQTPPYVHSPSRRRPQSPEDFVDFADFAEDGGSFSVRRSRRLASFPSRFGKRLRPGKEREGVMGRKEREEREEARAGVKVLPTQTGGATTTTEKLTAGELENKHCCHNEKRACLCLPLNSKNTGESQYSSKPFEQTLGASSSWLSRAHPPRKLPEQTELYAQLRRMGQAGANESYRTFGDHDYCVLSLGESRKRSADMLGAILQIAELLEQQIATTTTKTTRKLVISSLPPPSHCQSATATPPVSEEEAERSSASRSPSPTMHLCPDSPASKTDSSENSEICPDDKQRNKAKSDEDNCQVFYIHNLPTSVTQNMLRKRFQVFGKPEDCKVIICNEERCGVIKIRQAGVQKHWRDREPVFQNAPAGLKRLTRKRYIDLDEAGPGPVKSKYDALDFDTLLKEAQKSLHR